MKHKKRPPVVGGEGKGRKRIRAKEPKSYSMYNNASPLVRRWHWFWMVTIYRILHWFWVFCLSFLMYLPFLLLMILLAWFLHNR